MAIYCPSCGEALPSLQWEKAGKYSPFEANARCVECGMAILLEDRSSMDQEGVVEVIFR